MVVPVPGARHTFEDFGSQMHFVSPARRQVFMMFFARLWMIMWVYGMVAVGAPDSSFDSRHVFSLIWMIAWTGSGLWVLFLFLWTVAGHDVLEVSAMSVKLRKEIFGIGRTREYEGVAFRELRVMPFDVSLWARQRRTEWYFEGPLTFDYGSKTFRFGGVDEAEAKQIVQRIGERYPQYVQRRESNV
jgi:hypothetical protein